MTHMEILKITGSSKTHIVFPYRADTQTLQQIRHLCVISGGLFIM